MQLVWGRGHCLSVTSSQELDRQLHEIAATIRGDQPQIVELVAADGDTISIGLGRPLSVVSWTPGTGDPPYYASVGDRNSQGVLVFFLQGDHWTEFPMWNAIPVEDARAAMRQFFERHALPDNIRWEEV